VWERLSERLWASELATIEWADDDRFYVYPLEDCGSRLGPYVTVFQAQSMFEKFLTETHHGDGVRVTKFEKERLKGDEETIFNRGNRRR
jgi:hypothetical protein